MTTSSNKVIFWLPDFTGWVGVLTFNTQKNISLRIHGVVLQNVPRVNTRKTNLIELAGNFAKDKFGAKIPNVSACVWTNFWRWSPFKVAPKTSRRIEIYVSEVDETLCSFELELKDSKIKKKVPAVWVCPPTKDTKSLVTLETNPQTAGTSLTLKVSKTAQKHFRRLCLQDLCHPVVSTSLFGL